NSLGTECRDVATAGLLRWIPVDVLFQPAGVPWCQNLRAERWLLDGLIHRDDDVGFDPLQDLIAIPGEAHRCSGCHYVTPYSSRITSACDDRSTTASTRIGRTLSLRPVRSMTVATRSPSSTLAFCTTSIP